MKCMEWKELWLFGMNGKSEGCNVSFLNLCLSHARHAVKIRTNIAHYEKRVGSVWEIAKRTIQRDVGLLYLQKDKESFMNDIIEHCLLVEVKDGKFCFNFELH